ncbi:GEVED domain-containing protein [Aquimarina spinulae]|uniref:GEVED domain-containing protein n=1 Tax=Aquimarina spinulae TaxID=1192023 RepID=UPI000D54C2C1|nr:GEVED domain-containing protein [Aquimarina spinulae]
MKSLQYSLYEKKTIWLLFSLIMIIQLSFAQHHKPIPKSSNHSSDHCSRVSHENDGHIPSVKAKDNTFGIAKKAACQYSTNAEWGSLSTSALISAMRQTHDYDCYRDLFDYSSYSASIFSNTKVKAVANEVRGLASSYNGTNSTGIYGLTIYLHIAIYLDFNQTSIDLTPDTYSTIHEAIAGLGSNSSLLKHSVYAMDVLQEILIVAGDLKSRHKTASINLFERVLRDFAVNETWKSITDPDIEKAYTKGMNTVYNAFYNSVTDDFVNGLDSDKQSIDLLGKAAVNSALINKGGDFQYLWQNATGALAILAKSDKLIGNIQSHLAAITNYFPKLSPSWAKAKMALNQYGDCSAYNLCQHPLSIRQEVEEYLFPKTVSYDDDKMIIRTPLSDEKIQNLYHAAKQVQSQFFRLLQTDEPVAGDTNTTINMIVFGSKQQYDDYAPLLFGIRTDNGGMYLEGIATFYTWDRTVGVESSLSLESLFRHEYCHYLQGRYLVPGNWGSSDIYKNSRLVWYEEGMADFFAGSTDTNGVQMLAQNTRAIINKGSGWPSLNTVFNSSYTSGNFYHYTYGNAAWYNWYLNNFDYLKRFFDYTRNNDISGFDNFVSELRNNGETSYNNFLNKVKNEEVTGWQPTTNWSDDNQISIGNPSAIQNEIGNLPNTSNISVAMDAEKSYRRFKIEGKITGSGAGAAPKDIAKQLDNVILKLRENELVNNFKYTVGYFKNLNSSGSRSADFIITGPLKDADISDNPVAEFSATNVTTIAGGKIDFVNESTGHITGLDWSFPSGSPSSVTDQQTPQITYNSPGEYNVTLTAKGTAGSSDTKTIQNYIKVYSSGTNTYCSATNKEGGDDVHITKIQLGDFENTSGYTTSYVDYTSLAAIIRTNQSTTLDITVQNEHWSYNALGVWIDWNQDGDFVDAGEEVFHKYAAGPYNQQITPPSGAKLGTTRMRVRMSYGAEDNITPCGTQNSIGEIEDYSIIVTNDPAPVNTPPTITLLKPSNGQNFVQKENIAVETVIKDDEKVEKAELKVDGELISTDYVAPYQWTHINKLNFLSPGQHELTITAYDNDGATDSKSVTLNIEKAPITFCDASNEDSKLHITQVIFGDINNSTAHNPYSDHTNLSTVVQKGEQVALTIKTINENWSYNAIGAWIDWNQDGDFIDTDEEVFSLYGPGPYNGTVTVPSSALTGTPLRMRVRMGYGSKDKINPCGNDTYLGEVEDYTVYVGNSTAPTCNDGIQNGDETGVDCGGSCTPCQTTPTCNDGIQNGDETGVDCGGSCTPCATLTYCAANGNDPSAEHIGRVQLGAIDKISAAGSGGYNDFTSVSTALSKGIAHTITITPKWASTVYSEAYSVWVDYNQDGDFEDPNEQVWSKVASKDTSVNGSFTIPDSAKNGSTRMRVSMRYNTIPSPCGSFDYGEVEDYTISIGTGSTPTCNDGIQNGDETGIDCGGSCAPCNTDTGVVYVDINDITVTSSNTWEFFRIETGDNKDYGAWYTSNSVRLVTYDKDLVCVDTSKNVTLIGEGVGIDSASNFRAESNSYIISSSDYTDWKGKSGFVGFTFKISGNTHYGWFHISVANDGLSYTILDYAYQTNPNQTITTKVMGVKNRNEYSLDKTITISPNPFTENFVINTSTLGKRDLVVKVYDLQGKLLIDKKYRKNPGQITLGEQIKMSGSYFVKIMTDTKTETLQILKY